jgi:hypothetical protein
MATKEQYEFFSRLYDIEASRTASLSDRAKWYLSLTAAYSAAIGVTVEHFRPTDLAQYALFAVSSLGMVGAFVLSLWAVRVAAFEGVDDPMDVFKHLSETGFDQTKFFIDGMAAYAVAAKRNADVNARQANALAIAGHAMLIGIFANGLYFSLFLLPSGRGWPKIL